MLKTNLNPNEKHLANIENWLIEEWENTQSGFYSNWESIPKAFEEKRLSVITEDDYAIGFIVYKIYDLISIVDIAEIKQSERKKGVGKKMVNETIDFLKSKGILATQLYCSPENSEHFWKKIGFLNFPEFYRNSKINMYKLLTETLPLTNDLNTKNAVKLWNDSPYRSRDFEPNWIWDLNSTNNSKTLVKPIIFPVENNWKIEFIRNGRTVFSDEIKYYDIDIADFGDFMIIRELKH